MSDAITPEEEDAMRVAELAIVPRRPISSQPPPYASHPALASRTTHTTPRKYLPSSLPAKPKAPTIVERAIQSREYAQDRLQKSARLDTFMRIVVGKCPCCFARHGELMAHVPFSGCPTASAAIPTNWLPFKQIFKGKFIPFCYCYNCGMPQDRLGNGEAPDCHRSYVFKKGSFCPWADFIFISLWCLWHQPTIRANILEIFGVSPDTDYATFLNWITTEDTPGEYYKGLEVFLWYCEQWLACSQR